MSKVYLVSDEPALKAIRTFLSGRGVEVSGSAEILDDFQKAASSIEADVVIVNVYTPGVATLTDVVAQIRSIRPELRVILLFDAEDDAARRVQGKLAAHQVFDWAYGSEISEYGEQLLSLIEHGRAYADIATRLRVAFPATDQEAEDETPEPSPPGPLEKATSILSRRHVLMHKSEEPKKVPAQEETPAPIKAEQKLKKSSALRRRRALFAEQKKQELGAIPQLVAFFGAVPRSGVSTMAMGWALSVAEAGHKVCVIDAHYIRAALSVIATGAATARGWDLAPSPKRAISFMIRPAENLAVLPMSWNTGRYAGGREMLEHLPVALEAARMEGAEHVAVDLGSFPPLERDGSVDLRLIWARTTCDASCLITPFDMVGMEAAARVLKAAKNAGHARLVVMVGRNEEETREGAVAIGALAKVDVSEAASVEHVEGLYARMGQELPSVRVDVGLKPGPLEGMRSSSG